MAKLITLEPTKTYATRENAIKAVEKKGFPEFIRTGGRELHIRYFIAIAADGRFYPVFLGEASVQAGIHFHFNVVA